MQVFWAFYVYGFIDSSVIFNSWCCRWVHYDAAKPLLDKSLYSVLSDFSTAQDEMPQVHAGGPRDESSAKNGDCEILIDEDDEDSDYDESDMMVDEEMVHSESKTDSTEDCSDIQDIENVIMDLNGARVKYKVYTQTLSSNQKDVLSYIWSMHWIGHND